MLTESRAPAVEVRNVSKHFRLSEGMTLLEFLPALLKGKGWRQPFYALRNVSFSVERGETLGIIGRNGSGKSTLLKLIAGVTAPSSGEVIVRGRISPLIELAAGFHPDLTGRENIYLNGSILGLSNSEVKASFGDIVDFAEIWPFIDTPIKHYSSGMYMRLAFAVAAYSSPDILLIDEGLAVGDAAFQDKCLARMQNFKDEGATIVFVTHAVELARTFCDRLLLLDAGIPIAEGNPDAVADTYRTGDLVEIGA